MSCCSDNLSSSPKPTGLSWDLVCLVIAGFIAGNSTVAALVINLAEGETDYRGPFHTGLLIATAAVFLLLAPQLLRSVVFNLKRRRLSVDFLFLLGCIGALAVSLHAYFTQTGAVYFEVVSILLFVYCLGSWVKGITQRKTWANLDAWSPSKHRCYRVTADGSVESVLVGDVRTGDLVQVATGAMIPVDGTVEQGTAFVREATVTGEPHLRAVSSGDRVFGSSVSIDSTLQIKATSDGDQRLIDQVSQTVALASRSPSHWESQADWVASYFTPFVATTALVTLLFWSNVSDFGFGLLTALSVLLVACPCAFGFATPVSIWVAISRLLSLSIVIQKNNSIEKLAAVDTVVFDKTGTLTKIEPTLVELILVSDRWSETQIRQLAASVEAATQHPLAAAFENRQDKLFMATDFELLPAVGARASVMFEDRQKLAVEIGNLDRLLGGNLQELSAQNRQQLASHSEHGNHVIAIRIDQHLAAVAIIGEETIETFESGIEQLKQLGLDVLILSGDQGHRLQRLGIEATGGLTPEEKQSRVETLRANGQNVLFVGDGVNDAGAMAIANVSIAAASGAPLTIDSADLVWHDANLNNIAGAIKVSRRGVGRLRRALLFAITYNTIGMTVAALGWLHPVLAVVLMMLSSVTVVLHAADQSWEEAIESKIPLAGSPTKAAESELVQLG